MLPFPNRLKGKKDFRRVLRAGRSRGGGFLFLKLARNNLEVSRFGFVVGKRVSKKAVLRNKIRRRLAETIRKELPRIKPGFDGVWVAGRGIETKSFQETEVAAKGILQKAKLIFYD